MQKLNGNGTRQWDTAAKEKCLLLMFRQNICTIFVKTHWMLRPTVPWWSSNATFFSTTGFIASSHIARQYLIYTPQPLADTLLKLITQYAYIWHSNISAHIISLNCTALHQLSSHSPVNRMHTEDNISRAQIKIMSLQVD